MEMGPIIKLKKNAITNGIRTALIAPKIRINMVEDIKPRK